MGTMMAYCGLNCETCPVHLATIETDNTKKVAMRASIAEQLSKIYGITSKPDSITDCDGCIKSGRLFTGSVNCEIRKCAISKKLVNCAFCREYTCEKLEKHYTFDPESKTRLEEIRKNRGYHESQ